MKLTKEAFYTNEKSACLRLGVTSEISFSKGKPGEVVQPHFCKQLLREEANNRQLQYSKSGMTNATVSAYWPKRRGAPDNPRWHLEQRNVHNPNLKTTRSMINPESAWILKSETKIVMKRRKTVLKFQGHKNYSSVVILGNR